MINSLLRLFRDDMSADGHSVLFAHQKTIIHPDTKPGNVLVTDAESQPTPNGVDFEVARATEFTLARNSLADPGLSQNCRVQLEREWKGF
jgi:serine/threonine protein kinase